MESRAVEVGIVVGLAVICSLLINTSVVAASNRLLRGGARLIQSIRDTSHLENRLYVNRLGYST